MTVEATLTVAPTESTPDSSWRAVYRLPGQAGGHPPLTLMASGQTRQEALQRLAVQVDQLGSCLTQLLDDIRERL